MMRVYVALVAFFSSISSSHPAHYTSSGGTCLNDCGYHGYTYTWCKLNDDKWDYCSLKEGLDASGKKCDTPCNLWGGSYRYCHFKTGGWNYCSLLQQSSSFESSLENLCVKSCRVSGAQFQCETAHGLERCSPFQDVTPTGLPCHSNYQCAKYGWSAYRCHTGKREDEWDVCRPQGKDGCIWVVSDTNSARTEICTLVHSQNKCKLIFRRERQTETFPPTKEQFKDAVHFIDQITSITNLPDSGTLSEVHFYKEQSILCNGVNYTNVELWPDNSMNKPIAHVIFPEILSEVEVLRLAFYTSLHSTFYSPAYTIVVSLDEPMLCSIDHQ
ncbi:uncharacterized protein LOC134497781 [Candoia aspera]|uniref:uncharacterized protein LOC134497781 n=1 Tax=Candoia aspera TaxID=51853 RepID=UPI002FD857B7